MEPAKKYECHRQNHGHEQRQRKCQTGAISEAQGNDNAYGKTDENQGMPNPRNPSCKDNSRLEVDLITTHLSLVTSNNAPAYFTKADAVSITLAPTTNCKSISVFEPFARFAVGQLQGIRTAPGQFQHAATRFFCRAADCSARQQIAGLQIAAANCVMGELLGNAPIQILKIGPRYDVRCILR